jgi:hypothetical protein
MTNLLSVTPLKFTRFLCLTRSIFRSSSIDSYRTPFGWESTDSLLEELKRKMILYIMYKVLYSNLRCLMKKIEILKV